MVYYQHMNIKDLKFDKKNFNKHTEKGMAKLNKSISKLGLGRSIVVDSENNIIAGNATAEVAGELGLNNIRVIETSGDELVVVKRTDIKPKSKIAKELAIADNKVGQDNLEWDYELLELDEDQHIIEEWGLAIGNIESIGEINTGELSDKSSIFFSYPYQDYLRLLDLLANAREKLAVDSNEEVLKILLQKYE